MTQWRLSESGRIFFSERQNEMKKNAISKGEYTQAGICRKMNWNSGNQREAKEWNRLVKGDALPDGSRWYKFISDQERDRLCEILDCKDSGKANVYWEQKGLASQIKSMPVNTTTSEGKPNMHDWQYFAIVISPDKPLKLCIRDSRQSPKSQRSVHYAIDIYLRKSYDKGYTNCSPDSLSSKFFLVKSSSAENSFNAAIRNIVKHIESCKIKDVKCLLEFFVPDELLNFNWGSIRSESGHIIRDLGNLYPYLIRPLDRFRDPVTHKERETLKTKNDNLVKGCGNWIVGHKNPPALRCENEFVAIKQIEDICPKQLKSWCQNVTRSMVPLALWWAGGNIANITPEARRDHLEKTYGGKLDNHKHGDPVPAQDDHHYQLAFYRCENWSADEPNDSLVKNLVLLVDHPDRFPRALVAEGRQLTSP
jgi:hypothetical protein